MSNSDKKRFGLLYASPESESAVQSAVEASTSTPPETKLEPSSETTSTPPLPDQAQEDPSATTNNDNDTDTTPTAQALALATNDADPTHYLIRARQGHSIKKVDTASLLQKLSLDDNNEDPTVSTSLPTTVVHGTYHAAWPRILASGGLKCMSRNHIHFASGPELSAVLPDGIHGRVAPVPAKAKSKQEGVISGMRGDAQILIYIDIKKALRAGCPFWISENGVILSEGMAVEGDDGDGDGDGKGKGKAKEKAGIVPMEFFDVVVERKNGLGVLWEGGELLKETPEWMLNAKAPAGKGERRDRGRGGHKGGAPRLKVEKDTEYVEGV